MLPLLLYEAEVSIGQFIEALYHLKRRRLSLGYVPPAELEASMALMPTH